MTPSGSRRIHEVYPRMYSPVAWPCMQRVAPAKKRMLSLAKPTSSRAMASGLPTLADSSWASSSVCSSSLSASVSSISERSLGVVSNHSPNASSAAATARSTSDSPPAGISAIVSPVAGFKTSCVASVSASTHSPPTKFLESGMTVLKGQPPGRELTDPAVRSASTTDAAAPTRSRNRLLTEI